MPAPRAMLAFAVVVMHLPFIALLLRPMPSFLPSLGSAIELQTNYLHWCGLAYIHLKAILVVVDRLQGRLERVDINDYLAYMLFAPTFKMGPLYRFEHFVSQLGDAERNVQIRQGLARIGIGLLRLGVMVFLLFFIRHQTKDRFFTAPGTLRYNRVFLGFVCTPLELYFWLAGYCDIAIGIGRLMGFRVPEQFRGPWFVTNIADFWKRWSITLGQWLFDYPFRAAVASRLARWLCFVLTFLYCGLWHGFFRSYVIWGLMQGFGFAIHHAWHRWWMRRKKKNGPVVQRLRRVGVCDGRAGWALSWLLLVSYQLLTISIASDLQYAGSRFVPVLFGRR
jgi:D-alanyl-lipoteichoic acid acyltransferase DltB (MBOAT superfamily)